MLTFSVNERDLNKSIKTKDMKLTGVIIRFRLAIENVNVNLNEDQYDSQF